MPFADWLKGVREEAIQRGIRPDTVQRALDGVEPVPQILERDRAQAEFSINIAQYFQRRLTREILDNSKKYFADHRELLGRVQAQYGVQARYLVAVWALESNFGRFAGVRPMMPTLATLAYDPRRATLFRQQLFDALTVLDKGYIELDALKGSWAGAMGQPQFMPSSYLEYAQDFDGDGRRDIWSSEADVFASIAYYLQRHDWEKGEPWGRRVTVPASAEARLVEQAPLRTTGCRAERQLSIAHPISVWKKLGILRADGKPLPPPAHDLSSSLLRTDDGKSYLVSRNYEALLSYNCANAYALSVGHLGDAIEGLAPLPVTLKKKPAKRASSAAHAKGSKAASKGSKSSKSSKSRKAPAKKPAV
jgi:membrane-bound lytic murein transglycosylase B